MTPNAQQRKMLAHMRGLQQVARPYYAPLNGDAHKDLRALGVLVSFEVDDGSVVARLTEKGLEMVEKMHG
jgi:hypothetical protein